MEGVLPGGHHKTFPAGFLQLDATDERRQATAY